jgi:nucleoside-diphosphate-sugar epimerase
MPKVLVTGGYGFVGAELCKLLHVRGWEVVATHRNSHISDKNSNIASAYLPLSASPDSWDRALEKADCVVHLAAHVHQLGRASQSKAEFQEINVAGSRFVAERSGHAGVKRFVFLSSIKVNGEGREGDPYRATDIPAPQDAYARSKRDAEKEIRDVCESFGMEWVIVRPPLVYGPRVRANFRRLLTIAASGLPLPLASINNRRSLIAIENLVDFIFTVMTHPNAANAIWLVADNEDLSTPELIRRLAHSMHRPARLFRFPPSAIKKLASLVGFGAHAAKLVDSLALDSDPARELLGWKPPMGSDDGLARAAIDFGRRRNRSNC